LVLPFSAPDFKPHDYTDFHEKAFLRKNFLVKVFACKKALAQVLFLKESVLREKTEKFLKVRLACKRQAPEEGRRKR
jgi:hypothetical protein